MLSPELISRGLFTKMILYNFESPSLLPTIYHLLVSILVVAITVALHYYDMVESTPPEHANLHRQRRGWTLHRAV